MVKTELKITKIIDVPTRKIVEPERRVLKHNVREDSKNKSSSMGSRSVVVFDDEEILE